MLHLSPSSELGQRENIPILYRGGAGGDDGRKRGKFRKQLLFARPWQPNFVIMSRGVTRENFLGTIDGRGAV